jgi:hypothetical protein
LFPIVFFNFERSLCFFVSNDFRFIVIKSIYLYD